MEWPVSNTTLEIEGRLRVLVRIAHMRRCLDARGYEHVSRGIDAFGCGLGAWRKQADGGVA